MPTSQFHQKEGNSGHFAYCFINTMNSDMLFSILFSHSMKEGIFGCRGGYSFDYNDLLLLLLLAEALR